MPQLTLFVGKGGVGKTTVSAAYALHRSVRHKAAVLLISTDPAHSLSDIFGQPLGAQPRKLRLAAKARLDVWQVDAEKQFRAFLNRHKENLLSILEAGSIFSRADIEPLLETTMPGMAEMAALLAISDALASAKYDEIVVDTAPIGHTLRLFALPQYFSTFLDVLELASSRDRLLAERFGGSLQGLRQSSGWAMAQHGGSGSRRLARSRQDFPGNHAGKFALEESRRAVGSLRSLSPGLDARGHCPE